VLVGTYFAATEVIQIQQNLFSGESPMSTNESTPEPSQFSEAEQCRLLMENVSDYAIFLVDPSGAIATWNVGAKRILGWEEIEIVGKPFDTIFTRLDQENKQPEHELKTAREKGRVEDERWHVRKDGTKLWAMGVVAGLWDDAGKLRGYAKVMRDITERKQAEVESVEANRRKDEFLAMLGHELRNPLAPILNSVLVLRQDRTTSPAQQQALSMIDRQVRQLMRLVDDLLDVSRIKMGKIHLRKERVQLSTVLNHAAETARPLINARKHRLSISLPAESVWLDADSTRIAQVIANLLNNAAKYTEPGGQIWLAAERVGGKAIVRVKDTGVGILAEMLPRVFDLFTQADRSLDRAQGGLGIGLTLVRTLVQMHEGTVEAFSEGVGKGSEFVVRLPVVPEVGMLKPETPVKEAGKKGRPLRLLVVDDNVDTAESLAMLLRLYGHDVSVGHSGPAALQAVSICKPDVVLLDLGLPGMNGYEVARRLREQKEFEKLPLIAMTTARTPIGSTQRKLASTTI
jgi:PAS domain S-box-containing protein